MSQFEFLVILAGVVIGIAMAEIVSGWGKIVRTSSKLELDWLQFGWSVVILLNAMIYWVGIWPYADVGIQYLGQVYFLVVPTLFLVIISFAITPTDFTAGPFSFREYYMERRKPIFMFYAVFGVTSTAADYVAGVFYVSFSEIAFNLAIILANVYLAFTRNVLIHGFVMIVFLVFAIAIGFASLDQMMERFSDT